MSSITGQVSSWRRPARLSRSWSPSAKASWCFSSVAPSGSPPPEPGKRRCTFTLTLKVSLPQIAAVVAVTDAGGGLSLPNGLYLGGANLITAAATIAPAATPKIKVLIATRIEQRSSPLAPAQAPCLRLRPRAGSPSWAIWPCQPSPCAIPPVTRRPRNRSRQVAKGLPTPGGNSSSTGNSAARYRRALVLTPVRRTWRTAPGHRVGPRLHGRASGASAPSGRRLTTHANHGRQVQRHVQNPAHGLE